MLVREAQNVQNPALGAAVIWRFCCGYVESHPVGEPRFRDEDIDAVRKAFEVMGQVVLKADGKLQLIVLDHASRDVWGDIPGVVGLHEWRDGVKLVPMRWLNEA